jgi:hypothetical protein
MLVIINSTYITAPIYNGTLIQYNECQGKITKRNNRCCVIYRSLIYITKLALNTVNNYGLSVDGTKWRFIYLYLSGVFYWHTSYTVSAVEYGFDGYIVGDDNSLVIVNYHNSKHLPRF